MKLFVLPLLFSVAAFAQTPVPPAPHACLSGPVTLGSVTITCSMIDNLQANSAADNGIVIAPNGGFLLQVRVVSSDPATIAARIGVSFVGFGAPQGTTPLTVWGVAGLTLVDPTATTTPGFRYTFYLGGTNVTAVQVQELKVSNSQTF